MLDRILNELEEHCGRIEARLTDIQDTRVLLNTEERNLRAELKAGHAVFVSAKKTIDRAVEKHNERRRPVGRPPKLRAVS